MHALLRPAARGGQGQRGRPRVKGEPSPVPWRRIAATAGVSHRSPSPATARPRPSPWHGLHLPGGTTSPGAATGHRHPHPRQIENRIRPGPRHPRKKNPWHSGSSSKRYAGQMGLSRSRSRTRSSSSGPGRHATATGPAAVERANPRFMLALPGHHRHLVTATAGYSPVRHRGEVPRRPLVPPARPSPAHRRHDGQAPAASSSPPDLSRFAPDPGCRNKS